MADSELLGKKAPAFSLVDQDENRVTLADLSGQWTVLYFYPKDDTPGCTTQACEFTNHIKSFERLDAKVYGCSPDSPEKHRAFRAKYKLKVDLLSDPSKKMMPKYRSWGEKNMYGKITEGVIRSTVIISPEGKIVKHWKRVKAAGHAAKVAEVLTALQADAA